MVRGQSRQCVCVGALMFGLLAPSAVASGSGVTVDPNSPAGTEYAIPIQSAREQGSGKKGKLFGEGIRSRQPASKAAPATRKPAHRTAKKPTTAKASPAGVATTPAPPSSGATQLAADHSTTAGSGSGSTVLIALLLGALLVLAGAGWGGMKMRRSAG